MPPAIDPTTGRFVKAEADATAPPAEKPADDKAKPQDLSGVAAVASSFLGIKVEAPKPEQTEEEKAAAKTKKDAAATALAEKKRRAAAPKPAAREPLSEEQIVEAASRGAAAAMRSKPGAKTEEEEAAAAAAPKLDATQQRKLDVLGEMEKLYPDKYKGIATKYKDSLTALITYKSKWEKEHPGEEFDENAVDPADSNKLLHQEFFDRHEVDWNDEDYTEALAERRAAAKIQESQKETNARLDKFERAEKLRESAPLIAVEQNAAARRYWEQLGDDFKDVVNEQGVVNQEKLKKLQTEDPVLYGIRVSAAQQLDHDVSTIYGLMNNLIAFDEKNPGHQALGQFATAVEQRMLQQTPEDQQDSDGRSFLPADRYWKLPKAKRESHWTFTATDLAAIRSSELAANVKRSVAAEEEKFNAWAKARGLEPKAKPAETREAAAAEEDDEPPAGGDKPVSPSAGAESRLAAASPPGDGKGKSGLSALGERFLGAR